MGIPARPLDHHGDVAGAELARFSFSPLMRRPGTATLSTLMRSTYHWMAFTLAGLLKTALLVFSSMTSPPA